MFRVMTFIFTLRSFLPFALPAPCVSVLDCPRALRPPHSPTVEMPGVWDRVPLRQCSEDGVGVTFVQPTPRPNTVNIPPETQASRRGQGRLTPQSRYRPSTGGSQAGRPRAHGSGVPDARPARSTLGKRVISGAQLLILFHTQPGLTLRPPRRRPRRHGGNTTVGLFFRIICPPIQPSSKCWATELSSVCKCANYSLPQAGRALEETKQGGQGGEASTGFCARRSACGFPPSTGAPESVFCTSSVTGSASIK